MKKGYYKWGMMTGSNGFEVIALPWARYIARLLRYEVNGRPDMKW